MKSQHIFIILILLLGASCEKIIDLKPTSNFEGTVFIEGLLIEGRIPIIYVNQSLPFFDEKVSPQDIFARGATVRISDDLGTEILAPDSTMDLFRCRWELFYKGTKEVEFGKTYDLEVEFDGKTYTGSTTVNQRKPVIEEIIYTPEFFDLYGGHDGVNILLKDADGQGDFYRFQMNRKIDNTVLHAHVLDGIRSVCTEDDEKFWVRDLGRTVFNDEGNDGETLDLLVEVSFEYSEGDSTWVTIQSLDPDAAFFYKELDDQLITIVNPFVEPVFLKSEVEGGAIGFFGSAVFSDSVLFIYPQDNP